MKGEKMGKQKKKLLELQAVTAGYNNQIVLENINLTVYEQDFLGIIGANGSGKTTLLKVLLGLLKPVQGHVEFFFASPETDRDNAKIKKRIGYLPQQSMFDKQFPVTVRDVVLSGLAAGVGLFKTFSKKDIAAADEVLDRMGVLHLKNKSIGNLSGGQMQRVFLARALVASPAVLVLDEPDTFVDQSFSRAFYEILEELNRQMAIILVSHDLGIISSHVKTIACICRTLHYHDSNTITRQLLDSYNCPIDLITHGDLPHRVLHKHGDAANV